MRDGQWPDATMMVPSITKSRIEYKTKYKKILITKTITRTLNSVVLYRSFDNALFHPEFKVFHRIHGLNETKIMAYVMRYAA